MLKEKGDFSLCSLAARASVIYTWVVPRGGGERFSFRGDVRRGLLFARERLYVAQRESVYIRFFFFFLLSVEKRREDAKGGLRGFCDGNRPF